MKKKNKLRRLSVFSCIFLFVLIAVFFIPPLTASSQSFEKSVRKDTEPTTTLAPVEPCSSCEVFDMQNFSITLTAIAANVSPTPLPDTSNDFVPQRGSVFYIAGFLILIAFLLLGYRLWKSRQRQ